LESSIIQKQDLLFSPHAFIRHAFMVSGHIQDIIPQNEHIFRTTFLQCIQDVRVYKKPHASFYLCWEHEQCQDTMTGKCSCVGLNHQTWAELIIDNMDYVVDGLVLQLQQPERYPTAAPLFATLLHNSEITPALLPALYEPAACAIQGLSILSRRARPQHTVSFLMAMLPIVAAAGDEGHLLEVESCKLAQNVQRTIARQQAELSQEILHAAKTAENAAHSAPGSGSHADGEVPRPHGDSACIDESEEGAADGKFAAGDASGSDVSGNDRASDTRRPVDDTQVSHDTGEAVAGGALRADDASPSDATRSAGLCQQSQQGRRSRRAGSTARDYFEAYHGGQEGLAGGGMAERRERANQAQLSTADRAQLDRRLARVAAASEVASSAAQVSAPLLLSPDLQVAVAARDLVGVCSHLFHLLYHGHASIGFPGYS
jgi:hypothetical protein